MENNNTKLHFGQKLVGLVITLVALCVMMAVAKHLKIMANYFIFVKGAIGCYGAFCGSNIINTLFFKK